MTQTEVAQLAQDLKTGVAQIGLALSEAQIQQLLAYLALLGKWNKVYNLTSIRRPEDMLTHHLLDSLAAIPGIVALLAERAEQKAASAQVSLAEVRGRVLDVGSGGGLPGIPLAICCPQVEVVSVDTVQKKTAFQTQVKAELGLRNFSACAARVEAMTAAQTGGMFDVVTSRAFAELKDFVNWAGQHVAPHGCFAALKGVYPEAELVGLPAGWRVAQVAALRVPQLDAQRHLVVLEHAPQE